MDFQLFIVIVIGIGVAAIVVRSLYRFFFVKRDSSYCNGCKMCDLPEKKKY